MHRRKPFFENLVALVANVALRIAMVLIVTAFSGCAVSGVQLRTTIGKTPVTLAIEDDSISISACCPNRVAIHFERLRK